MKQKIKEKCLHTKNNETIINRYLNWLENQYQYTDVTISNKKFMILRLIIFLNDKKLEEITKDDVESYFASLRNKKSKNTIHKYKIELNFFFKWLKPDNDFFKDINTKRIDNGLNNNDLISEEEAQKIIQATRNTRDRALLHVMYDSAARIGELQKIKKSDVFIDQYGAKIRVNGKTGERYIRIVNSVPDLQLWLNQHTGTLNDPLFPSPRKMTYASQSNFRDVLNIAAKRAGIEKNVYPHLFRHSKLTDLHKRGMTETELKPFAGWTKTSQMAAIYIHLAESDIDKKVLQTYGIVEEEEKEKNPSSIRVCPFCKTKNPFDGVYCINCSRIIDQTRAVDPTEQKLKEMEIRMLEVERDAYIRPLKVEINDLKYNIEESKKRLKELSKEERKAEVDKMFALNEKIIHVEGEIKQLTLEYKIQIDELKNS